MIKIPENIITFKKTSGIPNETPPQLWMRVACFSHVQSIDDNMIFLPMCECVVMFGRVVYMDGRVTHVIGVNLISSRFERASKLDTIRLRLGTKYSRQYG